MPSQLATSLRLQFISPHTTVEGDKTCSALFKQKDSEMKTHAISGQFRGKCPTRSSTKTGRRSSSSGSFGCNPFESNDEERRCSDQNLGKEQQTTTVQAPFREISPYIACNLRDPAQLLEYQNAMADAKEKAERPSSSITDCLTTIMRRHSIGGSSPDFSNRNDESKIDPPVRQQLLHHCQALHSSLEEGVRYKHASAYALRSDESCPTNELIIDVDDTCPLSQEEVLVPIKYDPEEILVDFPTSRQAACGSDDEKEQDYESKAFESTPLDDASEELPERYGKDERWKQQLRECRHQLTFGLHDDESIYDHCKHSGNMSSGASSQGIDSGSDQLRNCHHFPKPMNYNPEEILVDFPSCQQVEEMDDGPADTLSLSPHLDNSGNRSLRQSRHEIAFCHDYSDNDDCDDVVYYETSISHDSLTSPTNVNNRQYSEKALVIDSGSGWSWKQNLNKGHHFLAFTG